MSKLKIKIKKKQESKGVYDMDDEATKIVGNPSNTLHICIQTTHIYIILDNNDAIGIPQIQGDHSRVVSMTTVVGVDFGRVGTE